MKINYDKIADAIYFKIREGKVAKTREVSEKMLVDADKDGNILGIELLDASNEEQMVKTLEKNIMAGIPIEITTATPIAA